MLDRVLKLLKFQAKYPNVFELLLLQNLAKLKPKIDRKIMRSISLNQCPKLLIVSLFFVMSYVSHPKFILRVYKI